MNILASEGMRVDTELRKKLIELLDLKSKLNQAKKEESNPIKIKTIEENLFTIEEIIGKIRYASLDELNIVFPEKEEGVENEAI